MASLQAKAAYMRKHRARRAGAAAPGPTGHSSAAHPAAARAAGAARAAARATAPARGNQDVTEVAQRGRAEGDAAAAPAHSAEQRESTSMWLLAERARDGGDPAAGRLRYGTHTHTHTHTRRPAMMWTCRMARTPPARSTAHLSVTALLATARMQGHAACPRQCS